MIPTIRYKNIGFQHLISLLFFLAVALPHGVLAQNAARKDSLPTVSPFDFGLAEVETDSARYEVLYQTHQHAADIGAAVSYQGIGTLTVEVTADAQPIPLTRYNNFNGLHLIVKNNAKTHYLFTMTDTVWQALELSPGAVDSGDFRTVPELSTGANVLLLEDQHLWVNNREGHKYGATRKDILMTHNGIADSRPISPYSTDSTLMAAKFHPADEAPKTITDLSITRDTSSTFKTYCFQIDGINNLKISRLNIYTPDPKNMTADAAINITNCTNLQMEDILIEGTYSRTNNYGYGIQMNNVWNSRFVHLTAHANWGIFGTNNLSYTVLQDCQINRFDIHCYGRDVYIYNCRFADLYNQFSSLYGTLLFDGCRFTNFVPVLLEPSYNAYTGFNLTFKDCTFDATSYRNFLISAGTLDSPRNSRPELAKKCWPNVRIQNLTVNVPNNVSKVTLFVPKSKPVGTIGHISDISIDNLRFHYNDTAHVASFAISSTPVTTQKSINYQLKNIVLVPLERMTRQATKKNYYPGSLIFNLCRSQKDEITVSLSRINFDVTANSQYNIRYVSCNIGMIRYNSNTNNTKRYYDRCTLYLNNGDDARYYIDNHAVYYKCTFVPCSESMFVSFYGGNNDVIIKNCKTTRKTRLFHQGQKDNIELKGFVIKGSEKYWK